MKLANKCLMVGVLSVLSMNLTGCVTTKMATNPAEGRDTVHIANRKSGTSNKPAPGLNPAYYPLVPLTVVLEVAMLPLTIPLLGFL